MRRRLPWKTGIIVLVFLLTGLDIMQDRPRIESNGTRNDGLHRYTGVIHVHSVYSDGSGTVGEIADAAGASGLDFVILTDHSTLQPADDGKQRYYGNSLVIIGEEVNTSAGHLLALGVGRHVEQDGPEGLPALLDTIRSSGGMNIIAHPYGRRSWQDWSLESIDGLELLNADSEWRNDNPWEWLRALLWYAVFPQASLNSLVDRPKKSLVAFDTQAQRGHTVAVGSVDAHARIPLWGDALIPFPSYARMFGWLRTYVVTEHPLTGDGETDTGMILEAIQAGRCYVVVEGYEPAGNFSFEYVSGDTTVTMGGKAEHEPGDRIRIAAESSGDILIRLFKDGLPVAEGTSSEIYFPVDAPGIYRAEVYQTRRYLPFFSATQRPWIFSNPIWLE